MRVIIEVAEGPHRGQTFTFEGHDTFLVGRSRRAHFRLPPEDRYFSRVHFLVEVNPPSCRLMDMGSKNGTFVNGKRVSLVDLNDGDTIQGGHTVLRVRVIEDAPRSQSSEDSGPAPLITPPRRTTSDSRPIPLPPPSPPRKSDVEACRACAAPLAAPSPAGEWPLCDQCRDLARRAPQPFPGYRVIRELSTGGDASSTYLAITQADGRTAALKVFTPCGKVSTEAMERFLRAAAPLKLLSHPYIAGLREIGDIHGRPVAVSDFIRGMDVGQLVAEKGPRSESEAVELICQLLEALDQAHTEGFVHRGLKPTSLRVTPAGMLRVVGFGLSGLFRTSDLSGLSLQQRAAKWLPFTAPEQVTRFREARPAADQYAAAALLYFLLTGKQLYDFPPALPDCMLMVLQDAPVPLRRRRPEVSPLLAEVVHRALSREPDARFADAASFLQALTNCQE